MARSYDLEEHKKAAQQGGYITIPDTGYAGQPGWAPGTRQWIAPGSPVPGLPAAPAAADPAAPMGGGAGAPPPTTPAIEWSTPAPVEQTPAATAAEAGLAQQAAAGGVAQTRSDDLYNQLLARTRQGLDVNARDPVIRGQVNAYQGAEERAGRDYLADLAESAGPYANLRGEQRLVAERQGQRVGSFQADLVSRELTNRRAEIDSALKQMGGALSEDKARALQSQLALLDNAISQRQLQAGGNQLAFQRDVAQAEQGRFGQDLAFKTEERRAYYDALRRGLLPGQQG